MQVFTDRSRIEDFQRCPRKRYLTYHQNGKGVVPVKTPLPLAVGGSVHAGLAALLSEGQKAWDYQGGNWFEDCREGIEEQAVRVALADFQQYTQAGLELDAFERAQMGPAQASGASTSAGTFEEQLVAQARALGINDTEVAQYEAALRQNRVAGAGGMEGFEKYLETEQAALVEALVRAYARRRLRLLLEQFEVLEVEREGEWKLSEWPQGAEYKYLYGVEGNDPSVDRVDIYRSVPNVVELWFMSRPDALLRERATNQLHLLSYKTTGAWDVRKARDAEHDMQGLSEGVEVEQRLGEWWRQLHNMPDGGTAGSLELGMDTSPKLIKWLTTLSAPPRILAVRYEYLLKGERWKDKDLAARFGFEYARVQKSPLLRQYVAVSLPKRSEAAFNLGDTCWSYDYVKEDGTAGSLYYGHWKSQPLAETGHWPVKEWINKLDQSAEAMSGYDPTVGLPPRSLGWKGPAQALGYTAEHPLDTLFVPPITVTRNDDDLRDLFESVEAQERDVAEAAAQVHAATDASERRSLMNQHFPMYRRSCEYPSECVFVKVCYAANADQKENPLASGAFRERVPNHPIEGSNK